MTTGTAIMSRLGGHRNGRTYMCRCPCHADRTASLAVRDSEVGPLVHCHAGCPQAVVIDELKRLGLWPQHEHDRPVTPRVSVRERDEDQARLDYARDIWNAAVDPKGTLAEKYLRGRMLELGNNLRMRVLRFHSQCPFGRDEAGKRMNVPALIAAFHPIRNDDGKPRAIHRIGLRSDGSKIDKRMLGFVSGCAVKLDRNELVKEGLAICEGIETGIGILMRRASGRLECPPLWALGSAGAIAKLEPIPGIECLTIFADNDDSGRNAATECARRWDDAGFEVVVRHPTREGLDYADA